MHALDNDFLFIIIFFFHLPILAFCPNAFEILSILQIDHSIVESFGGEGKACITARVYPTLAIDAETHIYVFNNGTGNVGITRLSAWSMKKAQIN